MNRSKVALFEIKQAIQQCREWSVANEKKGRAEHDPVWLLAVMQPWVNSISTLILALRIPVPHPFLRASSSNLHTLSLHKGRGTKAAMLFDEKALPSFTLRAVHVS